MGEGSHVYSRCRCTWRGYLQMTTKSRCPEEGETDIRRVMGS